MIVLTILIVAALSTLAFFRWRLGLFATLVMALAQDPLRKLLPNESATANLLVAVVFAAAVVGSLVQKQRIDFGLVFGRSGALPIAVAFFLLLLFLQAAHSLLRFGNPLITGYGLASYLAPLVAILFVSRLYPYGRLKRVIPFLWFYVALVAVPICTVLLEQLGMASPILGEVGGGITIFDMGTVLEANSGTFRASEIAAWHIANFSCLVLLLMTYRRPDVVKFFLACGLVAVAIYIGTLTGRRKFLIMIAIFAVSYISLLTWHSPRWRSTSVVMAILGLLAFIAWDPTPDLLNPAIDPIAAEMTDAQLYIGRTGTVFDDAVDRFLELGVAPIMWGYNRTGLFGAGLGVGTQGVQHLGNFGWLVGGAAEGGLGRFTVELGVPGLILAALVGALTFRRILVPLKPNRKVSKSENRLLAGFVAILISNAASFSIGQGMYGDIFVLLFNGTLLGVLLTASAARISIKRRPLPRRVVVGQPHDTIVSPGSAS